MTTAQQEICFWCKGEGTTEQSKMPGNRCGFCDGTGFRTRPQESPAPGSFQGEAGYYSVKLTAEELYMLVIATDALAYRLVRPDNSSVQFAYAHKSAKYAQLAKKLDIQYLVEVVSPSQTEISVSQ